MIIDIKKNYLENYLHSCFFIMLTITQMILLELTTNFCIIEVPYLCLKKKKKTWNTVKPKKCMKTTKCVTAILVSSEYRAVNTRMNTIAVTYFGNFLFYFVKVASIILFLKLFSSLDNPFFSFIYLYMDYTG